VPDKLLEHVLQDVFGFVVAGMRWRMNVSRRFFLLAEGEGYRLVAAGLQEASSTNGGFIIKADG
jgi:hypothetical protein